jgi:mono/diheme cytochrome c family protein
MKNAHQEFGALKTAVLAVLCLAGVAVPGCRGDRSDKPPRQFFPDLDDQPKWKPQSQSPFFTDNRTMRLPPAGTVAFGYQPFVTEAPWGGIFTKKRSDLLKDDDKYYLGTNADGTFLEKIPVPVTKELLARGEARYNIYCYVCHGYAGDGKGMVGVQIQPVPATFHDPRYKAPDPNDPKVQLWKDGYIFNTIRNGVKQTAPPFAHTMPPYAHAIDEADAWAIVSYVRALQESHSGKIDDVPPQKRPALEEERVELLKKLPPEKPPEKPGEKPAGAPTAAPAPAQPPAGGKS